MQEISEDDVKQIRQNSVDIAVIKTEVKNTNDFLKLIRENELHAISEEIKGIREKVDSLENVQKESSPLIEFGKEVIKTILIAFVLGALFLIGFRNVI